MAAPIRWHMPARRAGFYRRVLERLRAANLRHAIGGAAALAAYTGLARDTKDLDIFIMPADRRRVLSALREMGCETSVSHPHWLGKARRGATFVDLIWSSGNGVCRVDEGWFQHATRRRVFGLPVDVIPPEEMIWSKSYILERDRFDGADVAHIIRARGHALDWPRLLGRFGDHWPVLLGHLVFFHFIYPDGRRSVPPSVWRDLTRRLGDAHGRGGRPRVCGGPLLSAVEYTRDLVRSRYADPRLPPLGSLTPRDVRRWSDAIGSTVQGYQ